MKSAVTVRGRKCIIHTHTSSVKILHSKILVDLVDLKILYDVRYCSLPYCTVQRLSNNLVFCLVSQRMEDHNVWIKTKELQCHNFHTQKKLQQELIQLWQYKLNKEQWQQQQPSFFRRASTARAQSMLTQNNLIHTVVFSVRSSDAGSVVFKLHESLLSF